MSKLTGSTFAQVKQILKPGMYEIVTPEGTVVNDDSIVRGYTLRTVKNTNHPVVIELYFNESPERCRQIAMTRMRHESEEMMHK